MLNLPKRSMYNHRSKQFRAIIILSGLTYIKGLAKYGEEIIRNNESIDRELLLMIQKKNIKTALGLLEDSKKLENMKQAGLYSGDRDRKGERTTPAKKEDFDRYRELLINKSEIWKIPIVEELFGPSYFR